MYMALVRRYRVHLWRYRVLVRVEGSLYRALLWEVRCFSKTNPQRDLKHAQQGLFISAVSGNVCTTMTACR